MVPRERLSSLIRKDLFRPPRASDPNWKSPDVAGRILRAEFFGAPPEAGPQLRRSAAWCVPRRSASWAARVRAALWRSR